MCGLAGIARVGGGALTPESDAVLVRMGQAVAHRGPDGERIIRDGPVGLAFRRLALVDPDGGEQPFVSEDGSLVLMANGEVYNHRDLEAGLPSGTRFATKSDCEVLLHLYARDGLRFLDRVHGMFAVILWDSRRNRLVFARDRFGIKPLYFTRNGEWLAFASEIKALFEEPHCPRTLDWEAGLADQLVTSAPWFSHEPVTAWFRGIEAVQAGEIVVVDMASGDVERHTYWSLPRFDGDCEASDAEFVSTYRELLAASVADCASADAELGLFLSGGVDSAAVAALAAERGPLHTFTVLNGSTLVNGDAEHATRVAAALGLPNHQLMFPADRVPEVDEYKRLLWLLETPLCGPEPYYKFELYRFVKQLRPELRGMLLGQASDEFNGGYSVEMSGGGGWDAFMANLQTMARDHALLHRPRLASWWAYGDEPLLSRDVLRPHAPAVLDDPYTAYVAWKYRHIQQYNCWHEDRTAAGNGVEARVPFLDHRIIELMATVPAHRRARLLWDKWILREAVSDILPPDTLARPKVAFYHGSGAEYTHRTFVRMLARDGGALLEEAVSSPTAKQLLDADGMRRMLRRLEHDPAPAGVEFLLRLVNLGLLEQMTAQPPTRPVDVAHRDLPPASPVTDWARERERITALMRTAEVPGLDDVVVLRDDALLVHAPADPHTWYVAVDGQFEYVLDEQDDAAWCSFLRALDGRRTLAQSLEAAGLDLAAVRPQIVDALELGVLVVGMGGEP